MSEAPFTSLPNGTDIASYFWYETDRRNPGYDGISLYRDGSAYSYLWVDVVVDLDLWHAYLLDVRTKVAVEETRDYLFLFVGAEGRFDVEWHNRPIAFGASGEAHRDRFRLGMMWLTSRIERSLEAT